MKPVLFRFGLYLTESFHQDSLDESAAIPGRLLSSLISTAYIFGFRKDNAIIFKQLRPKAPWLCVSKKIMSLILLSLCLRKRKK